jgi:predicted glycogen debranching enzyme
MGTERKGEADATRLALGPEVLGNLAGASWREWLLADGLGGYASSTVIGANTRRYHGLLVAATKPPVGRMVLLSRVEESLTIGDSRHDLGTNFYPGAVHPRGFEKAISFVLDPLPTLTWDVGGHQLSRTVARVHGEPATVLLYRYDGTRPATLELRPLLAYRDYHALQHENGGLASNVERRREDVVLRPYDGCPELHLRFPGALWQTDVCWYRSFEYERERERGLDFQEDLWSPGVFRLRLEPGQAACLVVAAGPIPQRVGGLRVLEAERLRLQSLAGAEEGAIARFREAADAFVVRRGETGRSIIAGYHWFSDWGRDTMIALPGLCLATGRHEDARAILAEFARHVDPGMIPNRFPDHGEAPEYNTVDAPLWFVVAAHRFLEASGDQEFVRTALVDAVFGILDGYRQGTRHGIRMTRDALITQGEPGLQLTWMDAKVGELVVTPRRGLAVEIQALWFNALLMGAEIARLAGAEERAEVWTLLASQARDSFLRAFWSEPLGYLADVVSAGTRDLSLRPNQLYAIGLPHPLLPRDKALSVLEVVRRELLTPVGLRTLAPSDPEYRGRYQGDPWARDTAYHQGTVWPYLIGAYFDAAIRFQGAAGRDEARAWIDGFTRHLDEAGLGTIGEIFDGDPPHRPGGAIAQAWSVAEVWGLAEELK